MERIIRGDRHMDIKQKSAPQRELWAQFDALQLGSGWEEEDIRKPQILLEDASGGDYGAG